MVSPDDFGGQDPIQRHDVMGPMRADGSLRFG
jgi:hypothetical protein